MGKVTAITPQVKDDKRVNVYIDGAFACGLSLEAAVKNKVKVGAEIDEARLKEIEFDSEKTSAMEKTAAFISKTMKTEREVALFLARKGYSEAVVSFILEKYKSYGYIDDAAYAESYVKSYAAKKGDRLLKAELSRRGVSEEHISAALQNAVRDENAVDALAAKFMRGRAHCQKEISRLYRHLLSKGFSYEEAERAAAPYKEP